MRKIFSMDRGNPALARWRIEWNFRPLCSRRVCRCRVNGALFRSVMGCRVSREDGAEEEEGEGSEVSVSFRVLLEAMEVVLKAQTRRMW